MNTPEIAAATITFSPDQFKAMHDAFAKIVALPASEAEGERLIQQIQRDWHGMSEVDIRQQARERQAAHQPTVRHHGTVLVGGGHQHVHADLVSDHPLLKAVSPVIKEGPQVHIVRECSEEYWRLMGYSDDVIKKIKELGPMLTTGEEVELPDLSKGTGLTMKGINARTGRAALAGFNFPALETGRPGFDIGFTIDTAQTQQNVEVTILERNGDLASAVGEILVAQLPHLRTVQ